MHVMSGFVLQSLPPKGELETKKVLKAALGANRALAELKGLAGTIPNREMLINTLSLQEAKDSSAIENIITTTDELFRAQAGEVDIQPAAKEVAGYARALKAGFHFVQEHGLLTTNHINRIQEYLEPAKSGYRKLPGTVLRNETTGEVIYEPPQAYDAIVKLMENLNRFINDPDFSDYDPLVKMAVIHYQFESIHPYYDGNGRTGRIVNVLYLVQQGLLDSPILYLSRAIIQSKETYYAQLQAVRDLGHWEEWLVYILEAVENTAVHTIELISGITTAIDDYSLRIRDNFKFYSRELVENLFFHPYTKIEFVVRDLDVTRLTATKYLDELSNAGFLHKQKAGRNNYYINLALMDILAK